MLFEYADYRNFLKATLDAKAGKPGGYSLRAFSEQLSVSTSYLSEILNAKKSLSMELAFKIAVKLNLTDSEMQYFCLLVQLEQEKDLNFKEELCRRLSALNPKRKTQDLSIDMFKVISGWHHAVILELSYLAGFKMTPSSLASRLGISSEEAKKALERLLRLELLEKDGHGGYRKTQGYFSTESAVPQQAFREFHKKFLEKATEALTSQTPQDKVSITDVLAIDSKFLPEVERLSREYSSAVLKLSDKSKVKDRIYALITHFIKVT